MNKHTLAPQLCIINFQSDTPHCVLWCSPLSRLYYSIWCILAQSNAVHIQYLSIILIVLRNDIVMFWRCLFHLFLCIFWLHVKPKHTVHCHYIRNEWSTTTTTTEKKKDLSHKKHSNAKTMYWISFDNMHFYLATTCILAVSPP